MKKIILLFAVVVLAFTVNAQEVQFAKGDKVINVGIGLDYYRIPVTISGEYCIMDGIVDKGSIGVGAYAGGALSFYSSFYIMAGVRGAFHYTFIDKLDTYIGLNIGLDKHLGHLYSGWVSGGGFLGARYYMKPNMAFFGEIGYGLGLATVGVAFKL